MADAIRSDGGLSLQQARSASNPQVAAAMIVQQNRAAGLDAGGLRSDLAALQAANPALAPALEQAVLARLSPREQGEFLRTAAIAVPAPANDTGVGTATLTADLAQMTLDMTGIIDPTPISDGSNALISLGRMGAAAWQGDWGGAGGHLLNGTISAVGILPGVGDLAKAGKIGNWAETVANAISAAARSPAMRAALDSPLRELAAMVDRVPQSAINALPASARESFARMQTELDGFVRGGARQADNIALRQFDKAADFNRAANNAAANTRYEFGTYTYTTDSNGRVAVAEGTIDLTPAGRNDPDLQRQIGKEGRPTDVGFHVIGNRFNGQTNRLNVVQGNGFPLGDGIANLNQGAYKRFENQIARIASQPGNTVEVRIGVNYKPINSSVRPDSFTAQYRVNGGAWRTANGGEPFVNK